MIANPFRYAGQGTEDRGAIVGLQIIHAHKIHFPDPAQRPDIFTKMLPIKRKDVKSFPIDKNICESVRGQQPGFSVFMMLLYLVNQSGGHHHVAQRTEFNDQYSGHLQIQV